jgi:alpha-beta hydrolase superfamily lysophospholipase
MKAKRELGAAFLILLLATPLLAAGAGAILGASFLRPMRREWTPELAQRGEEMLKRVGARRADFDVKASDGAVLRGWKAYPPQPNGDWVMLFHGVSDNRAGTFGYAELLLRNGYHVVMMDLRAHGASGGELATFGWNERHDVHFVAEALFASERVHCFFLLGASMGASIALQAAEVETRVAGVVAESAFANLREVSFDYAGLRISSFLGRTLFRPASAMALRSAEKEGGFDVDDVSPEKAAAARAFPVLLICGLKDRNIPSRHSKRIYAAATGPKELWLVPGAGHTMALGTAPKEYAQRVLGFFGKLHAENKEGIKGL